MFTEGYVKNYSHFHPLIFFSKFFIVLNEGTLWHLQKFSQYIKYIILELTPFFILLYTPCTPFLE
jgi:hypothetical protein